MADSKLSALSALTNLAATDLVYAVRGSTSYKTTIADIRAAVGNIAGSVTNVAALPVTVGTPAVGTRYIVEEDQGSYFLFNKKPAGLYERTANDGDADDWTRLGDFTLVPHRDDTAFYDDADGTKQLLFQLSGITTETTRTATWPNKDGTVAMTNDKLSAFAATSSSELAGIISDETGTGALVFANTPTLVTPVLGTPTSGTLTNCTGLPEGGLATTDVTTGDASTTKHGLALKVTAPASGMRNVHCVDNGETARKDSALFVAGDPAALGTAAAGTALTAARSDHVHTLPKLDDVAAPDDNTDLNATTSAHGLLPKLGGGSTNFLRADGTWAAPAGGSSSVQYLCYVGTGLSLGDSTTYYYANNTSWLAATPNIASIVIPRSGNITRVEYGASFAAAGSTEDVTHYVRINDTTDACSAVADYDSANLVANTVWTGTQAVTAGDRIIIKVVTPAWGTNPTTIKGYTVIFFTPS